MKKIARFDGNLLRLDIYIRTITDNFDRHGRLKEFLYV